MLGTIGICGAADGRVLVRVMNLAQNSVPLDPLKAEYMPHRQFNPTQSVDSTVSTHSQPAHSPIQKNMA